MNPLLLGLLSTGTWAVVLVPVFLWRHLRPAQPPPASVTPPASPAPAPAVAADLSEFTTISQPYDSGALIVSKEGP